MSFMQDDPEEHCIYEAGLEVTSKFCVFLMCSRKGGEFEGWGMNGLEKGTS